MFRKTQLKLYTNIPNASTSTSYSYPAHLLEFFVLLPMTADAYLVLVHLDSLSPFTMKAMVHYLTQLQESGSVILIDSKALSAARPRSQVAGLKGIHEAAVRYIIEGLLTFMVFDDI